MLSAQAPFSWLIKAEYMGIQADCSGFLFLKNEQLVGLADTSGRIILAPQYDRIACFSAGRAVVQKNYKFGFIDTGGRLVVPLEYSQAGDYHENKAVVRQNSRSGFIDLNGNLLIAPAYAQAEAFSEGLAAVADDSLKWGYIDTTGALVIPFEYDMAGPFKKGLAKVRKNGQESTINYETTYFAGMSPDQRTRIRKEQELLRAFGSGATGQGRGRGSRSGDMPATAEPIAVESDGKWGIRFGKSGAWLVEPAFQAVKMLDKSRALVKQNYRWGLIRLN